MTDREHKSGAGVGQRTNPGAFGQLFVCGTPIGNLEDVTLRLLRTLREVSIIAAEDTRRTRKLLNHFDIHTPLISLHEHNEQARIAEVRRRLQNGESVALVSDAGMPAISDPGGALIRAMADEGIDIVVVPGPTAFVVALVGSGLATDRFAFEGFLPRRARQRRERLRHLAGDPRTLVFYEAPHRLRRTLSDMLDVWGDRRACVARELTKAFEQWQRAALSELLSYWKAHDPRGEFVIVVEGAAESHVGVMDGQAGGTDSEAGGTDSEAGASGVGAGTTEAPSEEQLRRLVLDQMKTGVDKKTAVRAVADETGVPRRVVYRAATKIAATGRGSDDPADATPET